MGILAEGGAVMPALGILYIAALMRKEGFPVEILDAEGSRSGISETVNSIVKQNPDVLGITATTLSILSAVKIAEEVKSRLPDIKVFIGGPHVTAMPMETIHDYPDVDGCVIGAGEAGFMKILNNINNRKRFENGVDGLAWRCGEKINVNPQKEYTKDLDSLPFPAWDMLKGFPDAYHPPFHSYRRLPVANIITTRGCPYACSFCDRSVFGQKLYSHSTEYIIEMIEYLMKDFSVREISIKDDMFILRHEKVEEFCRQVRDRKLNIKWSCNARVNNVNDKILREMKKAGCWLISYGIESGSPKILKRMEKSITKEQSLEALRITRKNGIVSKGFFMIGLPGETIDTMEETLEFIKELPLDELNINCFTPFPGTKFYNEALKEGFKPDFSRMNLIDTVYVPRGLSEKNLIAYQKKVIRTFYLKPSKVVFYVLRAFKSVGEFKRIIRMGKMFMLYVYSGLKRSQIPAN